MKKAAILTTSGKFKRSNGLEVEKTPEAIYKAFVELMEKKRKINLLQGGMPRGELSNFKLAILADGDNLPDGKLSINYDADSETTQNEISIDSAYITDNPLNDFAKVLHDNKDGEQSTPENDELNKVKAELSALQKEKQDLLKEKEAFGKVSEEHKAMKAEIESRLDSEIKELMPAKAPNELTEALAGKDKREQLKVLKLYATLQTPAVKAGAIVPVPDNSNEGEKPPSQYKYNYDK